MEAQRYNAASAEIVEGEQIDTVMMSNVALRSF